MRGRTRNTLVALLWCGVTWAATAARAQVDMNGPWLGNVTVLFGGPFTCDLDVVQTGTDLGFGGVCPLVGSIAVTGSIDPMTGSFSGSGTASLACPTLTLTSGAASLDGTGFFVQFACSGGPLPVQGSIHGTRCGNGVIDTGIGETCEDGNIDDGDCCSSTCHFDPPGQLCFPLDDNQCTDDVCDGAGLCTHPNRTGPCNDANQCTSGDTCVAGACVGSALPDGAACDDFNDCTDESCQGGTCAKTNKPDGTPCNDFFDCTAGETCTAGACDIGPPRVCPACERCDEGTGCHPEENVGIACQYAAASLLQLKKTDPDTITWKWSASQPVMASAFGDPTVDTAYELCVFDSSSHDPVTNAPQLLFAAGLPPGSGWKATATGFRLKSADKLSLRLKAGAAGKGRIVLRAKGPAHVVQYLPALDIPVTVYLRTADGVLPGACFADSYDVPLKNTDTHYRAQSP